MSAKATDVPCRSCGKKDLKVFLDLGKTPLADRLLTKEQLAEDEPVFPLEVAFCTNCAMVQILETVPPEILFCDDYPYFSSFSDHLLKHNRDNALDVIERYKVGPESLVVELASNDGYLLKNYVEQGIPVLGIDPAEGPAKAAEEIGVPTMNTFFTLDLAKQLAGEGKRADVIHANNVLAHVADTNGFVAGIFELLTDEGVAVIESPYCKDLIDHLEFDTIYHEHLLYLTATGLDHLFRRHNLYLNDVRRTEIHGGSLRMYVQRVENVGDSVKDLLKLENDEGFNKLSYFENFSAKVESFKADLLKMLTDLKGQGKRIVAYGAPAKGSTMINYVGIGTDLIEYTVDRNVHKQGKFMPGKHIPIYSHEKILEDMPDYVLILPWNFTEEILSQQDAYRKAGGKFIVPIPSPVIV